MAGRQPVQRQHRTDVVAGQLGARGIVVAGSVRRESHGSHDRPRRNSGTPPGGIWPGELPVGLQLRLFGGSPPTWIFDPCSSREQTEQNRTGWNSPLQVVWVSRVAGPSGARNHRSPHSSITMTCGKNARPLSVSRYSTRPEPALAATVSSTPIWQNVRSRSDRKSVV